MSAAATGGTIVINSAPTRHSSVALDYEMGLVRVAASSAALGSSTAGFRVRPNDVAMIAPSTPTKIVRSCPSTPTGMRTPPVPITGMVNKPNNKRSKVTIEESDTSLNRKLTAEHEHNGGANGIFAAGQTRLRDLLVSQLELIKKQSEAIIAKDRQLRELRQDNRALQQRLYSLGQNSNANSTSDATKVTSKLVTTQTLNSSNKLHASKILTKDKAVETTSELLEGFSNTKKFKDSYRNNGVTTSKQQFQSEETRLTEHLHLSSTLETSNEYYTFQGENFIKAESTEIKEILSQSEVPGWRTMTIPACYSMEGTENIEDETVLKRHNKPELDEKRRKRWDMQRMRQQRQVERLRARYDSTEAVSNNVNYINPKSMKKGTSNGLMTSQGIEKNGDGTATNLPPSAFGQNITVQNPNYASNSGGSKDNDWLTSLQPIPELATHVHVAEKLPVNAFGFCVPIMPQQDFSLPWLNSSLKGKTNLRSKKSGPAVKKSKGEKLGIISSTCSLAQKGIHKIQESKAANLQLTPNKSINGHINGMLTHKRQQHTGFM